MIPLSVTRGDIMKKICFIIVAAALLTASLSGCGAKPAAETEEAVKETVSPVTEAAPETEASEAPLVNMPNPMVPIEFSEDFELTLSIPLKAELIAGETEKFIIGNDAAHVAWNEGVNYTFRATKNAETAEGLHGIFDEKMSAPVAAAFDAGNGKQVDVTRVKAETEGFTIWTWKDGDTFYTLTADGDVPEENTKDVLGRCMYAAGITDLSKTIEPLPVSFDPEHVEDGIYYADFVVRDPGQDFSFLLFTREYFDVVDIHEMQVGDTIVQDGYESVIDTLTQDDSGAFLINGGLDEGGITLLPGDGGVYYAQGYDDLPTLLELGTAELPLSDSLVLTDRSDIEHDFEEHVVEGAAAAIDYICTTEWLYISQAGTQIRTEDGKVVEFIFNYTP